MINAVPKRFSVSDMSEYEAYVCPLSGTLATEEGVKDEWVRCPLVDQPIYLGICLDFQGIVANKNYNFEDHPYVDDFYDLSNRIGVSVLSLRKTCLDHQEEALVNMLSTPRENKEEAQKSLDYIRSKRAELN